MNLQVSSITINNSYLKDIPKQTNNISDAGTPHFKSNPKPRLKLQPEYFTKDSKLYWSNWFKNICTNHNIRKDFNQSTNELVINQADLIQSVHNLNETTQLMHPDNFDAMVSNFMDFEKSFNLLGLENILSSDTVKDNPSNAEVITANQTSIDADKSTRLKLVYTILTNCLARLEKKSLFELSSIDKKNEELIKYNLKFFIELVKNYYYISVFSENNNVLSDDNLLDQKDKDLTLYIVLYNIVSKLEALYQVSKGKITVNMTDYQPVLIEGAANAGWFAPAHDLPGQIITSLGTIGAAGIAAGLPFGADRTIYPQILRYQKLLKYFFNTKNVNPQEFQLSERYIRHITKLSEIKCNIDDMLHISPKQKHKDFIKQLEKYYKENKTNDSTPAIIEEKKTEPSNNDKLSDLNDAETAHRKITLKGQLKQCLDEKNYESLYQHVNNNLDIICTLVFKHNNFRGTIISHLINHQLKGNIPTNQDSEFKPILLSLLKTTYTEKNIDKNIGSFCRYKNYSEIYTKLMHYQVTDKEMVMADLQDMVLGIFSNDNLNDQEKKSLRKYLADEIQHNNTGQFRQINEFRTSHSRNFITAAIPLESYATKSIIKYTEVTVTGIVGGVAGAAGYGIRTILSNLNEFFQLCKIYKTTTFKSAEIVLSKEASNCIIGLQLNSNSLPTISPKNTDHPNNNVLITKKNTSPSPWHMAITNQANNTVEDIVKVMEQLIKGKEDDFIAGLCKSLSSIDNLKLYCIFTSRTRTGFLINNLLAIKFENNKNYDTIFDAWKKCNVYAMTVSDVQKTASNISETSSINQEATKLNKKPINLDSLELEEFKQFIKNIPEFSCSSQALLYFYRVIGIIESDITDASRKNNKMLYFAEICLRAEFDDSSVWHNLRKRGVFEEFFIRFCCKTFTALGWGAVSGATLASHGGILPIAGILQIVFLGGVNTGRNLINTWGDKQTHHNTKEYQQAVKFIDQYKKALTAAEEANNINNSTPKAKSENNLTMMTEKNENMCLDMERIRNAIYRLKKAGVETKIGYDGLKINHPNGIKDSEDNIKTMTLDEYLRFTWEIKNPANKNKNQTDNKLDLDLKNLMKNINTKYNELLQYSVDKYSDNQALFYLIEFIYNSDIGDINKIDLLLKIAISYAYNPERIAPHLGNTQKLSNNTRLITLKAFAGVLASIAVSIGAAGLETIPSYFIGTSFDILGDMCDIKSGGGISYDPSHAETITVLKYILISIAAHCHEELKKHPEIKNALENFLGRKINQFDPRPTSSLLLYKKDLQNTFHKTLNNTLDSPR